MRKLFYILFLLALNLTFGTSRCWAQQNALFSQYMFNKLLINPAFAGSSNITMGSLAYKNKFLGFAGAPKTMGFDIHTAIKEESMGIGIRAMNSTEGVTNKTAVTALYAYHVNMGAGKLSFGLEGGLFSQAIDFTNEIKADQTDEALPVGKGSAIAPDAAFGAYYQADNFYAGAAVYHLLQSRINYTTYDRDPFSQLSLHYYVTGGYTIDATEDIQVDPSLLVKYVGGAPLQIDINANATFREMATFGVGYRTGDALIFLLGYQFMDKLKIGYAYDVSISKLSKYNNGSHGVMLSYAIPVKAQEKEPEMEEEEFQDSLETFESEELLTDTLAEVDTALVAPPELEEDTTAVEVPVIEEDSLTVEEPIVEEDTVVVAEEIIEEDTMTQANNTVVEEEPVVIEEVVEEVIETPVQEEEPSNLNPEAVYTDITKIKGSILSGGVALAGVTIKLFDDNAELVDEFKTSASGKFSLIILQSGDYHLYLTKEGYVDRVSETLSINKEGINISTQNFTMVKL